MGDPDQIADQRFERGLRWVGLAFAVLATVAAAGVFAYTIIVVAFGFTEWETVLKEHFAAIIGLPGAAAVAFTIVVFLRQTDGPVEFEGSWI